MRCCSGVESDCMEGGLFWRRGLGKSCLRKGCWFCELKGSSGGFENVRLGSFLVWRFVVFVFLGFRYCFFCREWGRVMFLFFLK